MPPVFERSGARIVRSCASYKNFVTSTTASEYGLRPNDEHFLARSKSMRGACADPLPLEWGFHLDARDAWHGIEHVQAFTSMTATPQRRRDGLLNRKTCFFVSSRTCYMKQCHRIQRIPQLLLVEPRCFPEKLTTWVMFPSNV